jgi:hypothetical protein
MTPFVHQQAARPETVALTFEQIEFILYKDFCLDRDDARKFWDRTQEFQPAGGQ